MARAGRVALIAAGAAILVLAVWAESGRARDVLRDVYSPTFPKMPEMLTLRELHDQFFEKRHGGPGWGFLKRWLPMQAGVLWLSIFVALTVGVTFERPKDTRNIALVAMLVPGFLFYDILSYLDVLTRPYDVTLMDWVFIGIVLVSVLLMALALWRAVDPPARAWRPALPVRALAAVALLLIALDIFAAAVRPPDDAGYFTNLGGQRLRERGLLPYGDPILTGTPGAGYGPLLYAAHVPFQLLFDPAPANAVSSPRPPLGSDSTYRLPPPAATKLCAIAFHLLGLVALFRIGRRASGPDVGWALVALYAGSAYVLGVGGEDYFIGGMTFVSHIVPPAVTLAAFAALDRPSLAGPLLVGAAGFGFYPAFLAPAWLGFYWDRPIERRRFLVSMLVAAAILGTAVLLMSRPAGGRGLIGTILWDTFGHHSDPAGYGSSPFGFWGQRGGLRGWMTTPLAGTSGLTTPAFVSFLALASAGFRLARRRPASSLALVSAAIVIGANLIKVHSTGTYVAWYYPLLLIGFLAPRPAAGAAEAGPATMSGSS